MRAAAFSALRAGMAPIAIDLFADRDLVQAARVMPVRRWPRDVPDVARTAPPGPWMYTGALENHPRIVEAVSADRLLWGNPPAVLRPVRDPFRVHAALTDAGLPALPVRPANDRPPFDGTWMLKPRRSAGGRGVQRWTAAASKAGTLEEPHYFQRYVTGLPVSAVFVGQTSAVSMAGVSQQLLGMASLSARSYAYCGSIGPLSLPDAMTAQVELTGTEIGRRFGLLGLFGIDFVLCNGIAWPIEVNPRYTASVEVLEHALGISLVNLHRRAFAERDDTDLPANASARDAAIDSGIDDSDATAPAVAKAILYAPHDLLMPALGELASRDPVGSMPAYADLPHDGNVIRRGRPVCTVLAAGATWAECLELLNARLARVRTALGLPPGRHLLDDLPSP